MPVHIEVDDVSNQWCIDDVLFILRDKRMYITEKKMWLKAIDILERVGYYKASVNDNEKASLFGENR